MASSSFDFTFYIKCAKPLILGLPSVQDRSLASAWIKRLAEDKKLTKELQNNYLKLLIYFLQKRKLGGPFLEHPNNFDVLSDFPESQNLFQANPALRKRGEPYDMDFSGDLRTYVAFQEIENAGVHCYYALSKHPLTKWQNFDSDLFPAGIKPGGARAASFVDLELDEEPPAYSKEIEDLEEEIKKNEFVAKLENKMKTNENRKVQFVVSPLGKKDNNSDDRIPPSWGSNLILQGPLVQNINDET